MSTWTVVANTINTNHKELIAWLRALPYYYETDEQIFVHAGIDENASELWKIGTPKHYFANKFPATTGYFYKDIIAGHIATSTLADDPNYTQVYWDGISYYYIDGTVSVSGVIPVLKYDSVDGTYTGFRKVEGEWEEYEVGSIGLMEQIYYMDTTGWSLKSFRRIHANLNRLVLYEDDTLMGEELTKDCKETMRRMNLNKMNEESKILLYCLLSYYGFLDRIVAEYENLKELANIKPPEDTLVLSDRKGLLSEMNEDFRIYADMNVAY
ncbi:MAG: hypothetical protein LBL41_02785 [Bifidobacteriaceae bacterium]|jgi:hypothetical protein|nr:hypothetical protein [Bifidobacteriaceae bacterium]